MRVSIKSSSRTPRVPETLQHIAFLSEALQKKDLEKERVRGSDLASEVKNILSDWFGECYSSSVDV